MKKLMLAVFVFLIIFTFNLFSQKQQNLPEGWFIAGNNPAEYEIAVDNKVHQNGENSIFIKSLNPGQRDFATLMQTIDAKNYFGKRLKLTGFIKCEDVKGSCSIWMRIDGENKENLGFDNLYGRNISGTTEWKEYIIVLDVPINSVSINYGLMLNGEGQAWFDNFSISEVDKSVEVTNLNKKPVLPEDPSNLDFEK